MAKNEVDVMKLPTAVENIVDTQECMKLMQVGKAITLEVFA